MMKKIISFLCLGLFATCVYLPSGVDAAEVQDDQEARTTIRKVIDGVGPLSSPYETDVTLNANQSFELTRKFVFKHVAYVDEYGYERIKRPSFVFYYHTSTQPETHLSVSVPTSQYLRSFQTSGFGNQELSERWDFQSEEPEFHDVLFKLTNYSTKPATYHVYIRLEYY